MGLCPILLEGKPLDAAIDAPRAVADMAMHIDDHGRSGPCEHRTRGMGNRTHLSDWDQRIMSFMYPYTCWEFVDPSYAGAENGTLLQPFNTFMEAYNATCEPGTIWVLNTGTFGTNNGQQLNKRLTIRAAHGTVTLTR